MPSKIQVRDKGWLLNRTKINIHGCQEWTGALVMGYGNFRIGTKGVYAHRFMWELCNGSIPAGMFVMHRCDNRRCINPYHLTIGTPMDNTKDMKSKGRERKAVGEQKPNARVTPKIVIAIRGSNESGKLLSARYGLPSSVISNVRTGKSWRHMNDIAPPQAKRHGKQTYVA